MSDFTGARRVVIMVGIVATCLFVLKLFHSQLNRSQNLPQRMFRSP